MAVETMFDSIPKEIVELLVSFSDTIQDIEDIVTSQNDALKVDDSEIPTMQRVQRELSLAYAMNALFFVYLKCQGADVCNHPIKKEIDRVAKCLKRCQNMCEKQTNDQNHPRIDKEAAKRFIKRTIWQSVQSKSKKMRLDNDS